MWASRSKETETLDLVDDTLVEPHKDELMV